MNLKLGKKAPTPDDRDLLFATYTTSAIKAAPVGFGHLKLVTEPWGVLLNDELGDCAIAGPAHETMLLNAAAGKQVAFTDANIVDAYTGACGYDPSNPATDEGCIVRDVLGYRNSVGLTDSTGAVHKIGAYVAVKTGDWVETLQALYVMECVGLGIQVPQSAMDQFQAGQPWTVVHDSPIIGGHYVPLMARPEEDVLKVITWGQPQLMTRAFFEAYCDEAWCYISLENLTDGKTLEGFDVAALQADLEKL